MESTEKQWLNELSIAVSNIETAKSIITTVLSVMEEETGAYTEDVIKLKKLLSDCVESAKIVYSDYDFLINKTDEKSVKNIIVKSGLFLGGTTQEEINLLNSLCPEHNIVVNAVFPGAAHITIYEK